MNTINSGTTTPATGLSSNRLRRSHSQETLATTVSEASSASHAYPGPPVNSPENQSVAGEMHVALDKDAVVQKLEEMNVSEITPPHSEAGEQTGSNALTPTATKILTFEHSTWEGIAAEDVSRALKRMAALARDLHAIDSNKSVEEHYSERLAAGIKQGELRFDASHLK